MHSNVFFLKHKMTINAQVFFYLINKHRGYYNYENAFNKISRLCAMIIEVHIYRVLEMLLIRSE